MDSGPDRLVIAVPYSYRTYAELGGFLTTRSKECEISGAEAITFGDAVTASLCCVEQLGPKSKRQAALIAKLQEPAAGAGHAMLPHAESAAPVHPRDE